MAALTVNRPRNLFGASLLSRPRAFALWTPGLLALPRILDWTLPSLRNLLELFPPFLLAVPKKKTSHSRKAMRSANKGLKDKGNIVHCPACGSPKLAHHLCVNCYTLLSRTWKRQTGQESAGGASKGGMPDLS